MLNPELANLIAVPPRVGVAFAVLDRTSPQVYVGDQMIDRVISDQEDVVRHAALDVINDYLTGRLCEPTPNRQSSIVSRQPEGNDATAQRTT